MKEYENVNPGILRGTNASEPPFPKTQTWLKEQFESGSWEAVPPVVSLQAGEEQWVIDGNHRRDFAEENGLSVPRVISVETDSDIQQLREQGVLSTSYSKVNRVSQLRSLLERRLK